MAANARPEKAKELRKSGAPEEVPPRPPPPSRSVAWQQRAAVGSGGHQPASALLCLRTTLMDPQSEGASSPQTPEGEAGGLPRI